MLYHSTLGSRVIKKEKRRNAMQVSATQRKAALQGERETGGGSNTDRHTETGWEREPRRERERERDIEREKEREKERERERER